MKLGKEFMFIVLNVSYMFPVFNIISLFWIMFFTNDNTKINVLKVNLLEYIGYLEKKHPWQLDLKPALVALLFLPTLLMAYGMSQGFMLHAQQNERNLVVVCEHMFLCLLSASHYTVRSQLLYTVPSCHIESHPRPLPPCSDCFHLHHPLLSLLTEGLDR